MMMKIQFYLVIILILCSQWDVSKGHSHNSTSWPTTESIVIKTTTENRSANTKQWWEHANFYQLYPRSFKDSDGDGIGDLKGIISRLYHLYELGITATWLSPIFASPQKDLGYDVSDFYTIEPAYGTMEDFDNFIRVAHSFGIKILLDFIPNHTSDEHQWFIDSEARKNGKDDYYVWRDGKNCHEPTPEEIEQKIPPCDGPPNNWVSVFGGSAWDYSFLRRQYYLHQFTKWQPDLNYRSQNVVIEMTAVLTFYLDKGIDGFRLDAINHMFEDAALQDEPKSGWTTDPNAYDYLEHIHTKDQQETYDMVYDWRELLDEYTTETKSEDRILMTEAYTLTTENNMRFYVSVDGKRRGAHMPFNFNLIYAMNENTDAKQFRNAIENWMTYMPCGFTPSWVVGSHDHSRLASRFGSERAELATALIMMLPGTSITYYGEEIAMVDNRDFEIVVDGRDYNRCPMQWDTTQNAGFTTGNTTWLPVHENYKVVNVEAVKGRVNSIYYQYRQLTAIRKEKTLIHGDYRAKVFSNNVFGLLRELRNEDGFVLVLNLGTQRETMNLSEFPTLPPTLTVETKSSNSLYEIGDVVKIENVILQRYDFMVLRARRGLCF